MRHGIHPVSRPVVFRDRAAGFQFLTRSTLDSDRTVEWEDGTTYPVVDVEISSASHRSTPARPASSTPRDAWSASSGATAPRQPAADRNRPSPGPSHQEYVMKVRKSLRPLKAKPGAQVVRRRGVTFVITKTDPRFKARQG